jgi:hypothetical protein
MISLRKGVLIELYSWGTVVSGWQTDSGRSRASGVWISRRCRGMFGIGGDSAGRLFYAAVSGGGWHLRRPGWRVVVRLTYIKGGEWDVGGVRRKGLGRRGFCVRAA